MSEIVIKVSDYCRMPGVKLRVDGKESGQEFREDILTPALLAFSKVTVDFDGVLSLGSNFLHEVFTELVLKDGFTASELRQKMLVRFDLASYIEEIWMGINNA